MVNEIPVNKTESPGAFDRCGRRGKLKVGFLGQLKRSKFTHVFVIKRVFSFK